LVFIVNIASILYLITCKYVSLKDCSKRSSLCVFFYCRILYRVS